MESIQHNYASDVDFAAAIATKYHAGQKYGDRPYTYHLQEVVTTLLDWGESQNDMIIIAAWLHDIVEDTEFSLKEVGEFFGSGVENIVDLVTDPPGLTREERKEMLHEKFQRSVATHRIGHHRAALLKFADRYANQKNAIITKNEKKMKMYVREFPDFIRNFGPSAFSYSKDGKAWPLLLEQYTNMVRLIG